MLKGMPESERSSTNRRLPAKTLRQITTLHIKSGLEAYRRGDAHSFDDSDDYDLLVDGERFPPKAILGLAALESLGRVLTPNDFSGGLSSTCFRILEEAGFSVVPKDRMLALTTNDTVRSNAWGWEDEVGVRYHFPNHYKNLIIPGRRFVYYRGVERADGTRRSSPEYFGLGVVGEVSRDDRIAETQPKRTWQWFAQIEGYTPFRDPLPWADSAGEKFEDIPVNLFRNGARPLTPAVYRRILKAAGVDESEVAGLSGLSPDAAEPPATTVTPPVSQQTLVPANHMTLRVRAPAEPHREGVAGTAARSGWRKHRRAVEIGRRGESLLFPYLQSLASAQGWGQLDWLAQRGVTPGYDISLEHRGQLYGIEVKSTTLSRFPDLELTINEWRCAQRLGSRYWLALVTDVESPQPKIQWIPDPAGLHARGILTLETELVSLQLAQSYESPGIEMLGGGLK